MITVTMHYEQTNLTHQNKHHDKNQELMSEALELWKQTKIYKGNVISMGYCEIKDVLVFIWSLEL